ncbi:uncharacterized protein SOCE836_038580 [Sorangium cellulosum]|uniref:Uncharacterized protein n=1 Tax=Sorangium cellulosum TaxID=56 RepID=A0A4P2QNM8_SORCE|nr:uncharacterized protein SOCE836_038580 [Sorangium cellulosum]WCQ91104.1 hypothetical protein NQZ70_03819 [Sorangium sp. Soce836]
MSQINANRSPAPEPRASEAPGEDSAPRSRDRAPVGARGAVEQGRGA